MATITPAYSWPVPTSSDLVKDGATAIEALGDAIDASMNTALGTKKAGMVLLQSLSFSGVSSQSINDVFSATYDNYRIIYTPTSNTTTHNAQLRFRVGGSDATATNYWYSFQGLTVAAASTNDTGVNQSQIRLGEVSTLPNYCVFILDLINPFLTTQTKGLAYNLQIDNSNVLGSKTGGFGNNQGTSYTGFSIVPSSATTFAGTIRVYGYNN